MGKPFEYLENVLGVEINLNNNESRLCACWNSVG
jgi:hypothetical protein